MDILPPCVFYVHKDTLISLKYQPTTLVIDCLGSKKGNEFEHDAEVGEWCVCFEEDRRTYIGSFDFTVVDYIAIQLPQITSDD